MSGDRQAGGSRSNAGKLRWTLLPLDALAAVVEVLEMGARKYADRNWEKGLSWSQTTDSLLRHVTAWYRGEQRDPESGLPHLSHVACNALFLLAHELRGIGVDDRPGAPERTRMLEIPPGAVLGLIEPSPLGPPGPPPRADELGHVTASSGRITCGLPGCPFCCEPRCAPDALRELPPAVELGGARD